MSNVKSRNWAFVFYPDSWPSWYEDIKNLHVSVIVSPLHDADRKPDGELKKPHYHAILQWPNTTTVSAVLNFLSPFGIAHVEPVADLVGYTRYLTHMDDPDKFQYCEQDIVIFGDANYSTDRPLTDSERKLVRAALLDFVRDSGITEYAELVYVCRDEHSDWCEDVENHTVFWRGLLSSIRAMYSYYQVYGGSDDGGGGSSPDAVDSEH